MPENDYGRPGPAEDPRYWEDEPDEVECPYCGLLRFAEPDDECPCRESLDEYEPAEDAAEAILRALIEELRNLSSHEHAPHWRGQVGPWQHWTPQWEVLRAALRAEKRLKEQP
jgi:hypothetical protein